MLFDRYNFSTILNERFMRRARLITQCQMDMGINVANVADQDLALGLKFIKQLADDGFPYVSANLRDDKGNPAPIPAYRIIDVGALKVGVFGLLTDKVPYKSPQRPEPDFTVSDPVAAARESVEKLKQEKVDLIVALSNLGLQANKKLAEEVKGINFMISGHDIVMLQKPERVGETLIFQSLHRGMYLGVANIVMIPGDTHFVDAGERESVRNEMVALGAQRRVYSGDVAELPEVKQRLAEMATRMTQLEEKAKQLLKPVSRVENNLLPLDATVPNHAGVNKRVVDYNAKEQEIIQSILNAPENKRQP